MKRLYHLFLDKRNGDFFTSHGLEGVRGLARRQLYINNARESFQQVSGFCHHLLYWLVVSIPLKNISQLGGLFPYIWENNPVMFQESPQLVEMFFQCCCTWLFLVRTSFVSIGTLFAQDMCPYVGMCGIQFCLGPPIFLPI